jgi:hypothetical protein
MAENFKNPKYSPNALNRRAFIGSLAIAGLSASSSEARHHSRLYSMSSGSAQSVLQKAVQYFNCNNWTAYRALLDPSVSIHEVHGPNGHAGQDAIDKLYGMVNGVCLFVPHGAPTNVEANSISGIAYWRDDDGSNPDILKYKFEVKNGLITRLTTATVGQGPSNITYACPT